MGGGDGSSFQRGCIDMGGGGVPLPMRSAKTKGLMGALEWRFHSEANRAPDTF